MHDAETNSDDPRAKEVADRVKDIVIHVLELHVDRAQLTDDVPLYSSALRLDSLALLHLLVRFEQEFGIEIDDEDVMNAELRDVGSLVELVRGLVETTDHVNGKRL
ncbi:phosphopantetheine-binding protein [Micromonospora sp. NPDC049559]|uniref:phosphopantetheine-binding protein n=1 Tax=Micromonospora sp. NPDC049559 TaxID=3155923 RepID=UPI003412184D